MAFISYQNVYLTYSLLRAANFYLKDKLNLTRSTRLAFVENSKPRQMFDLILRTKHRHRTDFTKATPCID